MSVNVCGKCYQPSEVLIKCKICSRAMYCSEKCRDSDNHHNSNINISLGLPEDVIKARERTFTETVSNEYGDMLFGAYNQLPTNAIFYIEFMPDGQSKMFAAASSEQLPPQKKVYPGKALYYAAVFTDIYFTGYLYINNDIKQLAFIGDSYRTNKNEISLFIEQMNKKLGK